MLECQHRRGNIIVYEVRYNSSDNVKTLNTSNGDETNLLLPDLEVFTNYSMQVRAYTAVGPGPYSNSSEVRTLTDGKHIVCYIYYT